MMTDKTSFEFFDWLLEYDRSEELKSSYTEYFLNFNTPETYNPETHQPQDWDTAFGYSEFLKALCLENAKKIKANVASNWQNPYMTTDKKTEYLQITKKKAEILQLSAGNFYKTFPFVAESLSSILKYIEDINFLPPTASSGLSLLSFKWVATPEQLYRLFDLLTASPAIISGSRQEYENAFQGREVSVGIKWLKTTNKGEPLKSLLIYFINQLQEIDLIEKFEPRELGSRICYVFRDRNNKQIENFKQSKSQHSGSPLGKELIDNILDEITK